VQWGIKSTRFTISLGGTHDSHPLLIGAKIAKTDWCKAREAMGWTVFLIAPGTLLAQIAIVLRAEIIPKRRGFLSAIQEERSDRSYDAEDDEDGAYHEPVDREPGHCVLLCIGRARRSEMG
jgi:hypothetical protein